MLPYPRVTGFYYGSIYDGVEQLNLRHRNMILDSSKILSDLKNWSYELGFQDLGVASLNVKKDFTQLENWIQNGYHGSMSYLEKNKDKRLDPSKLVPDTACIITVRANYLTEPLDEAVSVLKNSRLAYVSRYALGRDYHKVLRGKLRQLARKLNDKIGHFGYRAFTDSAPILERALARNSGLGWVGKHTNLINKADGSMFFLGEIFTDLPLNTNSKLEENHCGTCVHCMDVCPTDAIISPYKLDARKCISYLTIESKDAIPLELRTSIGNRIFGCDDCQLFCPWNKYAKVTSIKDFMPRSGINSRTLLELFLMNRDDFELLTRGSAIRRISYEQWVRNLAVALGNSPYSHDTLSALNKRKFFPDQMVREHIEWAVTRQEQKQLSSNEQKR
jgi:epoxyqueuosine reductase